MRIHGTLTKWNDDRGFGFITPSQGDADIFVHISAFPRNAKRPEVNEIVSFETEITPDGKLRAVRAMRPADHASSRQPSKPKPPSSTGHPFKTLFAILAIGAIGVAVYSRVITRITEHPVVPAAVSLPAAPTQHFSCDGRTMCSQMTSCAEATYFLNNCPNTQMDGNNDGEPCEQQWCN